MTNRRGRAQERVLPTLAALGIIAAGAVWATTRIGYPEASGIVEETIGGPAVAAIVTAVAGAPVALGVGLLDGLLGAVRRTAVRVVARTLLHAALGAWCALTLALVAEIDCDGTCLAADRSVIAGGTVAAVLLVVVAFGIARGVDRIRSVVSRARTERSGREATA